MLPEERLEVLGQGALKASRSLTVVKLHAPGVESLADVPSRGRLAVPLFTEQWVAEGGEVDPDLVRASRLDLHFEQTARAAEGYTADHAHGALAIGVDTQHPRRRLR